MGRAVVAIEYSLSVSGPTPVAQVAQRAVGDPRVPLTPWRDVLNADLSNSHGYSISVRQIRDAYFSAAGDSESADELEWEVPIGVTVTYTLVNEPGWTVPAERNMLASVAAVLAAGAEDAALLQNGDVLLLTRVGGVVHKVRRDRWWAVVPGADEIIP
ncbi:SitI3 family protein [Dactylosporangium sp. NPDC051541]|uniref:SitI3 family protein n=1 Tax=Dactylosporangium sp. NPDC051541 TaxID=3363977 RepID=UPI0037A0C88D